MNKTNRETRYRQIKKRLLFVLATALCVPLIYYVILKAASEFVRLSEYKDYAEASSDGRSFFMVRRYLHNIQADIVVNQTDGEQPPKPQSEMILDVFNFYSTDKKPEKTIHYASAKHTFDSFLNAQIKNGEFYWVISTGTDSSTEYRYYPKTGKSPLIRNTYDHSVKPVNTIEYKWSQGFCRYFPLTAQQYVICKDPDIKKDVNEFLQSQKTGAYKNQKFISIAGFDVEPGYREDDFLVNVSVILTNSELKLSYFYDSGKKQLIKTHLIKTENGKPVNFIDYATTDDRFINIENEPSLFDTKNLCIIKSESINSEDLSSYEISPDGQYAACLDNETIKLIEIKTGKSITVYKETRQDHIIPDVFWFPPENCLIAEIVCEEINAGIKDEYTEIISIDPFAGKIKTVSPPCPSYRYRNNQLFSYLFTICKEAKSICDYTDNQLGIRKK